MSTLALMVAGLFFGSAPEADLARAKEFFGQGQKLYKMQKYTEAISKFEEAFAVRPTPVIFFNIGKCYEQLGEPGKAMRAYRDYLRAAPDAKDKESVGDSIANLERKLRERGVQQLLVFADPPAARVEVDGKDLGVQPASTELTSGSHKIVVRAEGFETVERSFSMAINRAQEVTVNLKPSTPAMGVAASDAPRNEPKTAALTPSEPRPLAPDVTASPLSEAPKRKRVMTWVLAGVAVASAGAGVGLGVVSNSAATELRGSQHNQADATRLYNQASAMSLGANISYGVAAGAAIAAVVLFFVEK